MLQEETEGTLLYDLGNGQWNITHLRKLLEEILPEGENDEGYEVQHTLPTLERKILLLSARNDHNSESATTPNQRTM